MAHFEKSGWQHPAASTGLGAQHRNNLVGVFYPASVEKQVLKLGFGSFF
jgi:hypothetical protein